MLSMMTLWALAAPCSNRRGRMSDMRKFSAVLDLTFATRTRGNTEANVKSKTALGRPALRLAHHEIAEHLYPRHCFQLFRIDEIGVELDRIGLAEQLYEPA